MKPGRLNFSSNRVQDDPNGTDVLPPFRSLRVPIETMNGGLEDSFTIKPYFNSSFPGLWVMSGSFPVWHLRHQAIENASCLPLLLIHGDGWLDITLKNLALSAVCEGTEIEACAYAGSRRSSILSSTCHNQAISKRGF